MPVIKPDLTEVNKPIEPGTYEANLTGPIDLATSKAGNPMLVIKLGVQVNGKTVPRTLRQVVTGAGAFGFEQLLRACKFGDLADDLRRGGHPDFDTDKLIGQKLQVVVEADTYNGQITDKITGYLPA